MFFIYYSDSTNANFCKKSVDYKGGSVIPTSDSSKQLVES